MKVRASLIEIFKRLTPVSKDNNKEIYWNGEDNLYPSEIEGIILNSPTAKRASTLMAKFIAGRGVLNEAGELAKYSTLPFVNKAKGYKITDIIRMSASDMSRQGGVWLHRGVGIDENGELYWKTLDVLTYSKCRKAKDDDSGGLGKIYFKDYAEKTRKKKDPQWFYPFSPSRKVLIEQIKADSGKEIENLGDAISKYRGQVFYLNLTPQYTYALSPFDSVYNDADTEYRMGLYTNNETRSGFMGKTIFLTQGLDEKQAEKIKSDLAEFMGSEGSAPMYHLDVDSSVEDLSKVLFTQQLKAQFDDEMFDTTDKRITRNILGAANGIPQQMVFTSDGALFGTNADAYREYKLFYSEQVEEERELLQETLTMMGFPTIIEPILKVDAAVVNDKQADAQAALRGSVGGVTALIQLQQSVSQGFTTKEAAIEIIVSIYGIDRETAVKMVGDPIDAPITQEPNVPQQ